MRQTLPLPGGPCAGRGEGKLNPWFLTGFAYSLTFFKCRFNLTYLPSVAKPFLFGGIVLLGQRQYSKQVLDPMSPTSLVV